MVKVSGIYRYVSQIQVVDTDKHTVIPVVSFTNMAISINEEKKLLGKITWEVVLLYWIVRQRIMK